MITSCDHCEAVRQRQRQIAWGGQPMTPAMNFPDRYYTGAHDPSGGMYDGDPGPCDCRCHDVWRAFNRLGA